MKNTSNILAPIVLFAYNRPWHIHQTLESLKKNELANQSDLIIFSDAARKSTDTAPVQEVRRYIKTVKGFNSVNIIERTNNFGLANSIIDGVSQVINEYGNVIVLEDDLVTSPYFLKYMNDGLRYYENAEDVISIHGYIYPMNDVLPETFFLRGADCWGWATWKRGWALFERDGKKLLNELQSRHAEYEFDFNGSYPYTRMLRNQISGKNNSWAIRWHASAFLRNKFTLYPGQSLVQNIGHDGSGTHCGSTDALTIEQLAMAPVQLCDIAIQEHPDLKRLMILYFRSLRRRLIWSRIVRILKMG